MMEGLLRDEKKHKKPSHENVEISTFKKM